MSYYDRMRKKNLDIDNALILAIETSCDETSVAITKKREVLVSLVSSQIPLHRVFGGVVPEIASRKHIQTLTPLIDEALKKAGKEYSDIDLVAVANGPGLIGALLSGTSTAKALAFSLDIPLVAVHHLNAHICANFITNKELEPPFLCLIVSGGHTHIVDIDNEGHAKLIGQTLDDAAGEAFDKVGRVLGLNYPGGPEIDKLAKQGDENAINFPRSLINDENYNFSFSGLKTAVINYVHKCEQKNEEVNKADVAASFQKAVTDVLVTKTMKYATENKIEKIVLAGGVSANSKIRNEFLAACKENGKKLYMPDIKLCTDNAAMIGVSAYYEYKHGNIADLDINAYSTLSLPNTKLK